MAKVKLRKLPSEFLLMCLDKLVSQDEINAHARTYLEPFQASKMELLRKSLTSFTNSFILDV